MAYTTIDDPSAYFQTALYTGNGGTLAVTNDGNSDMQPDWVWAKSRTQANSHVFFDVVRTFAGDKEIQSNNTGAEGASDSAGYGYISAVGSDGFTAKAGTTAGDYTNVSSQNYVAWNWKAGTSFTNDASSTGIGGIDSAGSFNNTAGFSIVTYTGNAGTTTVKHGMNVAPKMIWFKRRNADSTNWYIYHASIGQGKRLVLNTTAAEAADTEYMNNTAPTTSVFSLGPSGTVNTTGTHLAYCFAEIKGYSKFGSYVSNGSTDGNFVYTGFKPAWIMVKKSSGTQSWYIGDNKRLGYNPKNENLNADTNGAEFSQDNWDVLSNGFKIRQTGAGVGTDGDTYIYCAIAESPFVTSTGVPATAR